MCKLSFIWPGLSYSWSELRNTLDVYSSSRDVFDKLRATLLGLEKAKAVPRGDWESAPMSETLKENREIRMGNSRWPPEGNAGYILIKVSILLFSQSLYSSFLLCANP